MTGGVWAVLFYVGYLHYRGFAVEPLFIALFAFTLFITTAVSADSVGAKCGARESNPR